MNLWINEANDCWCWMKTKGIGEARWPSATRNQFQSSLPNGKIELISFAAALAPKGTVQLMNEMNGLLFSRRALSAISLPFDFVKSKEKKSLAKKRAAVGFSLWGVIGGCKPQATSPKRRQAAAQAEWMNEINLWNWMKRLMEWVNEAKRSPIIHQINLFQQQMKWIYLWVMGRSPSAPQTKHNNSILFRCLSLFALLWLMKLKEDELLLLIHS